MKDSKQSTQTGTTEAPFFPRLVTPELFLEKFDQRLSPEVVAICDRILDEYTDAEGYKVVIVDDALASRADWLTAYLRRSMYGCERTRANAKQLFVSSLDQLFLEHL